MFDVVFNRQDFNHQFFIMKLKITLLFIFACAYFSFSQITGQITDSKNNPLTYVNIYLEGTYIGTTSNDDGFYELPVEKNKDYTIVFKYLGYKTLKKKITTNKLPLELNIILQDEEINLEEVVVNANENPANRIIREAINHRKSNLNKTRRYSSDFYSRGLIKIKNAPEKFLGQDLNEFFVGLDSTRSGIIYLSETISKIQYEKPNLKEHIIASKISGDNNGFSFNSAREVDFNFYNNTIELGNQIISPIADYAFNYYNYKLEGVFYDDNGNLINKVKVIAKRENDSIFSGYIYIIEDQWSIYALELEVTGAQAQMPAAEVIKLKQTFSYSNQDAIWSLMSQEITFSYGFFKFKGDGHFTSVYSNYNFKPDFNVKTFKNEILTFENEANKKDSIYWDNLRPIPLTKQESSDYKIKDSIQIVRESKTYLDSVDNVKNKFKIGDLLGGYSYQNSYKNSYFSISSPISAIQFNTVQGYNGKMSVNYRKNYDEYKRYLNLNGTVNYGLSDKRLRGTVSAFYRFNNVSRPQVSLSGGVEVKQFNTSEPISPLVNTVSSLFFEDNYMKIYERSFIEAAYNQELFNGFRLYSSLSYEKRKALFNTTDYVAIPEDDDIYTSNNPLDETAFGIAPFQTHNIVKLNVGATINFGQKYLSYPDSKFNIPNEKFPRLYIGYEKGFSATNSNYNFDQIKARIYQSFNIENKGDFTYNIRAGKFFNADDIAFMDYQHFNGNETHVSLFGNYTNVFNNLPYYSMSTNKSYLEMHAEHNFKGYILGKIPLLNKLNFNLILGAHNLATEDNKPYQEFTIGIDNIGWGKFRFLRVDYIRSYQNGFMGDAVLFGIKL